MMKKSLCALAIFTICLTLSACNQKQSVDEVNKTKNLNDGQNNQDQSTKNGNTKTIFIKTTEDTNYLIYLDETGNETIIDQFPLDEWSNTTPKYYGFRQFSQAKFSPKENYIIYKRPTDEGATVVKIYDIKNKIIIEEIDGTILDFTPDEKYIYACNKGSWYSVGKVYEVENLQQVYDVHGKIIAEEEFEFYNDYYVSTCNWEDKNKRIRFHLTNIPTKPDASKEVYYEIRD